MCPAQEESAWGILQGPKMALEPPCDALLGMDWVTPGGWLLPDLSAVCQKDLADHSRKLHLPLCFFILLNSLVGEIRYKET